MAIASSDCLACVVFVSFLGVPSGFLGSVLISTVNPTVLALDVLFREQSSAQLNTYRVSMAGLSGAWWEEIPS
jgi:hypothetical protein